MASPGQLMLAIGLSLCLPAAWADGSESCRADGPCEVVQGASMLQAKSQRSKTVVVRERSSEDDVASRVAARKTWKRSRARHRARAFMHNGKLMTPYGGNWVAGAFGHCTRGCDPPVKERSVECKDFWDGTSSHDCPHLKPSTTVSCSCALETCVDTPVGNCTTTGAAHPSLPGAPSTAHYTFAGCFDLDSGDSTAAGDFMDTTCMNYSGSGKCRSGLPFFRNTTATTALACATFCLGKGLDIFGIVNQAECRCGASSLNEEVWHGGVAPAHLAFDGYALTANDQADLCPLEVYHYTGYFNMGGVPLSLLKTFADTSAYIDSVVAGHTISPVEEDSEPQGPGLLQHSDGASTKAGFELSATQTPAETITISGACDYSTYDFQMNGEYENKGVTESGAPWYIMQGALTLYFDPSCDGSGSNPKWVLDCNIPDRDAPSDLDSDGACSHWAELDASADQLTIPETATWNVYCPSEGGWKNLDLTITSAVPTPPTPPTPAPPTPAPTPAPPTPEPTQPACLGDSSTWNGGYGGCDTYSSGSANHDWCSIDIDCPYFAIEVCEGCGACKVGPTPAPTFPVPTPALPDCVGDSSSWDAGYGGCDAYQYGMCNHAWCAQDKDNGVSAAETCHQCLACTEVAAVPTPAPTSSSSGLTATFIGENMKCKSKNVGTFFNMEYDGCLQACGETSGCTHFSYKPLNSGGNAPGVCWLGKCWKSKTVNNWWSYKLD